MTGTESYAYFAARVASVGALILSPGLLPCAVITQSLDHLKLKFVSQLIKSISRDLQKITYNGATISTSLLLLSFSLLPVMLVLNLRDSKSVIESRGSSL